MLDLGISLNAAITEHFFWKLNFARRIRSMLLMQIDSMGPTMVREPNCRW